MRYPGKLAVCVAHFNPCGYRTRETNFRQFAEAALSQGADVHVVSAGPVPFVGSVINHLELGPCDTIWQKERALNVLIDQLPDAYDKVAWVDADVLFDNPHWVEDTSLQLERTPVCQCFEWAVWLSQAGVPEYWNVNDHRLYRPSVPLMFDQGKQSDLRVGHPGFAWAARRETLKKLGGLYDRHVLGSGDSIMALGFLREIEGHPYFTRFDGPFRAACEEWCRMALLVVGGDIGYVPGTVRHLWHGTQVNRNYDNRLISMALAGYDPARDLELADNGLWRWSPACPPLVSAFVKAYFHARNEDGTQAQELADTFGSAIPDDRKGYGHL